MPKAPSYFFHDAVLNKNGHTMKFESALEHGNKPLSP